MNKFLTCLILTLALFLPHVAFAEDNATNLNYIGFHKKIDIAPEQQIKDIFYKYQKYSNSKSIDDFMNLYSDSYISADGYDKNTLKKLATESWDECPNVRYQIKVLSFDVNVDNATVITTEKLNGVTKPNINYVKGSGFIDSESTSIYYLKRYSNEWKIVSDFVITEKTSLRYGIAKYIPMMMDAPALVTPNQDYTAILKMNMPSSYVALISINNEPITYPIEKSTEVFRTLKQTGIQERILKSNLGLKNENAVASVGIAKTDLKNDAVDVNLLGIAFLSTRVNVMQNKSNSDNEKNDMSLSQGINGRK